MLNSIKSSLKDTLIYGLGNIAVKVVGLILIPLYTDKHFFSIDEFGVLGILEISGMVLAATLVSALPQSFTRWYWDKEHIANQKGIFFMSLMTQLVISLALCILLIPLSATFSVLLFSKPDWSGVITLLIISSGIQAINNIINTMMRLQSKSLLYTITNLFKLTSVLALTLFFILSKKMGLEGIYLAQVIGNAMVVLVLLGYTIKNSTLFFDKSVFKSMNYYGFPLFLANISGVFLNVIDRYVLNSQNVLKYVALYTLAFKITSVLKFVIVDSMKLALGPIMLKRMDDPDNKRFYSKVLLYSSYVLFFAIIGVSLFSFEIIKLIAKSNEFWNAVVIIPILSLSIFFVNMNEVTIMVLNIAKKSRIIGLIIVFTSVLSLALNFLLIPLWDITGAAVATLLSQFIYWIVSYYYSQKVFFVPNEIRKITVMFLAGAVLSFSSIFLNEMYLLPRIILKTGCLISFPFILYLLNFYETTELQAIRGFVVKWSNIKNFRKNIKSLRNISDELL